MAPPSLQLGRHVRAETRPPSRQSRNDISRLIGRLLLQNSRAQSDHAIDDCRAFNGIQTIAPILEVISLVRSPDIGGTSDITMSNLRNIFGQVARRDLAGPFREF